MSTGNNMERANRLHPAFTSVLASAGCVGVQNHGDMVALVHKNRIAE